ncbi:MAG: hypothetical protein K8R18_06425 [Parvibaculum sp.]|uniref:hypothetical protein n=1 Tax=Parvibaculum sp. TaxID=2024848 RepID=UPI0025E7A415|nr:hypothetical protein [Parvibaculum sp.]MCE9649245.1 hypothetical protein [Parvibaculum sp.]
MKSLVQAFFALAVGLAVWTALPAPALADKAPECMQSDTRKIPDERMQEWWDKRTPEQQTYIRDLPCKERYIPMVCIFLFDPDLKGCTNKGVAESRANAVCQAKGYDLMSQELLDCKNNYKKTFKMPFS